MGRRKKPEPLRLPEKLLRIRRYVGVTQKTLWESIRLTEWGDRSFISHYENGSRTPPPLLLLSYKEFVELHTHFLISVEDILDDSKDLPF